MSRTYYRIHFGKSVSAWEFASFDAAKKCIEETHWSDPAKLTNDVRIVEYKIKKEEKVVYGKGAT